MATLQEVLTGLEQGLKDHPEKLAAAVGVYQLDLTGDGGGTWSLNIEANQGTLSAGAPASPGVVVIMTVPDFIAMATGKLNGVAAFMAGKLKIKGDMSLALKLQTLLG